FDKAFTRPDEVRHYLLHEIGHTNYNARVAAGGFTQLPPEDWMRICDWRTTSDDRLAGDLGLSPDEVEELRDQLEADRELSPAQRTPAPVNGRMVSSDPSEARD